MQANQRSEGNLIDQKSGRRVGYTRVLVLHLGLRHGDPAGHQALPFVEWRAEAARRGLALKAVRVASDQDRLREITENGTDVVIDFRHWSEAVTDVHRFIREVRRARPQVRYVLMDYYASSASPHLDLLAAVDLYAKRQVLRQKLDYYKGFAGGFIFTDFLQRELGYDLRGWRLGGPAPAGQADRIMPVWNLGAIRRYGRIAMVLPRLVPWSLRRFDLNVRIGLDPTKPQDEWYQQYRRECIEAVRRSPRPLRLTGQGRVSHRRYLLELAASRVVFSPFGWGEVCFRDYEAVACGCLMLKQDMSHLDTEPDIYRPMETYVPVNWDLSNLQDRLEWIFSHPREAKAIAMRGREVLSQYFRSGRVVDTMVRMVEAAQAAPRRAPTVSPTDFPSPEGAVANP